MSKSVKLVVVGDGAVGKTCMLVSFAKGKFPEEYVPVFENYSTKLLLDDWAIDLGLWDTAVSDKTSLENVTQEWFPEVQEFNKEIPVCLVGTKVDLRDDAEYVETLAEKGIVPITKEEGMRTAKELKCDYYECSAKTGEGLKEVFQGACRLVLGDGMKKKKSGGGCFIL